MTPTSNEPAVEGEVLPKVYYDLQADSPLAWIVNNDMVTEQGNPLEFDDHPFLVDIYEDDAEEIIIIKSAQVGGTIWATVASAHEVTFEKRNSIYVFPTKGSIVNDFVIPKVNPIIEKNGFISRHIMMDNQKLKQFEQNFLYYRGAFSESDAISISADTVWSDEYDRSNVRVVRTYRSRTENSKQPRFRTFSNPSAKGFGVDHLYQGSDQRVWIVTCDVCGHKAYIDWDPAETTGIDKRCHTIDVEKGIYRCGMCWSEISDQARRAGFWYARFPDRPRHGYWINQMMRPDRPASRIIQQWEDDKNIPGYVYNFILGKAYTPADSLIDRTLFTNVATSLRPAMNDVFIGVDVGHTKHIVVMTPEGIVDVQTFKDWDQVEALFLTLNAHAMVIDAMPDITTPKALAKKYPGRVYIAEFDYDDKRPKPFLFNPPNRKGVVKIQRTQMMDLVVQELRTRRIGVHLPGDKLEQLIEHSIVMVRIQEKDDEGKGKLKVFWITQGEAPDHFWFALIYARTAMMRGIIETGVISQTTTSKSKTGVEYNQQTRLTEGVIPDYKKKLLKARRKGLRNE